MYLLDTDVISQRAKRQPHINVMEWLKSTPSESLRLSVVSIQEIRAGAEGMPVGRNRRYVEDWLERDLLQGFADKILTIDTAIADACGRLIAQTSRKGHTPGLGDALIAATAQVHGLSIATLNRSHFIKLGVELVAF